MNKILLNKEQVLEAIEIAEVIKEHGGKHDLTWKTYVFPKDDKFYKFEVEHSYNEGIQIYCDITAVEVKQVEKTVKVWEIV